MPNVGPFELAIVLIIALIVFGPKRLPELGHSLGKAIREFRGSVSGESPGPERPEAIEPPVAPAVPPAPPAVPAKPPAETGAEGDPVAHDPR